MTVLVPEGRWTQQRRAGQTQLSEPRQGHPRAARALPASLKILEREGSPSVDTSSAGSLLIPVVVLGHFPPA